ncbi:hypothetical protein GF351_04130 [Candidatus Woesearchaeota archaeon]|nr:hypothetical protein [Candidatus Woesearchaeota archaeon]
MRKIRLSNELTVLLERRPGRSVAVEVTVKAGSIDEKKGQRGISHFIEHMLFEGTTSRTALQIAGEIEGIGGEISAFTSNERTSYYVNVLSKHLEKGVDVLSDIIQNPLFDEKILERERKIVLSEIKMVTDQPRFHQWVLFQKALYGKSSLANPTYGTVSDLKRMCRKDLVRYHHRYYVPSNMVISIVGDFSSPLRIIRRYFGDMVNRRIPAQRISKKPSASSFAEKKPVLQSYLVLGFDAVRRSHPDSYVLDVIRAVLAKGLSGRLFQEIRQKRGLAYDVGASYESGFDYGFFAVYVSTDKNNLSLVRKVVLQELELLKDVSSRELLEAKRSIEGDYLLSNEDNREMADTIAAWAFSSTAEDSKRYVSRIKKVTQKDIARVVDKYFKKKHASAVIRQD